MLFLSECHSLSESQPSAHDSFSDDYKVRVTFKQLQCKSSNDSDKQNPFGFSSSFDFSEVDLNAVRNSTQANRKHTKVDVPQIVSPKQDLMSEAANMPADYFTKLNDSTEQAEQLFRDL